MDNNEALLVDSGSASSQRLDRYKGLLSGGGTFSLCIESDGGVALTTVRVSYVHNLNVK